MTDNEAISEEIKKIDEAIADIDAAITDQQSIEIEDDKRLFDKIDHMVHSDHEERHEAHMEEEEDDQTDHDMMDQANVESTSGPHDDDEEGVSDAELEEFRHQEEECPRHPAEPGDTRRFFDHPPSVLDAKISALSRFQLFIKHHNLKGTVEDKEGVCHRNVKCKIDSKYRSYDGTCNNLKDTLLGSVYTPYQRLIPAVYGDGESLPRGVKEYSEKTGYVSGLPSPRKISDVVFDEGEDSRQTESRKNTHMVMQWGQFIDHDIISTSKYSFDCCDEAIRNHPRCFPIDVSPEDSFFSQFGKTCLDFTRSNVFCKSSEKVEQYNAATSFLDGSAIYGSNEEAAMRLRKGRDKGKLAVNSKLKHLLPSKFDLSLREASTDMGSDLVAGDNRAETQASLTSLHSVLLNEHNRIAEFIHERLKDKVKMSAEELDELVYQETRRIVVAQVQEITYKEFLPEVIGMKAVNKNGLHRHPCIYKPEVNPSIFNSFGAAAFRFGHSLIQSIFRGENQPWRLGKFFADSRFATKNNGDGYMNEIMGLSKQPCQKADVHISKQMTQLLFCNNKTMPGGGHDIGALNIQRGRDHGIPAYNTFRQKCGLPRIKSLSEPNPSGMDPESWSKLASVYRSVDEIDLYAGGLAEKPEDGIVGPTFACIIGKQFKVLMEGDRFFHHHTGGPDINPIAGAAGEEIRARTLGALICEATTIPELSQNVFIQEGSSNQRIPCDQHRKMDLEKFVDQIKF